MKFAKLIPVIVAVSGVALAAMWLVYEPGGGDFVQRVPGQDVGKGGEVAVAQVVDLRGKLERGEGVVAVEFANASWPWFRGRNLDNIAPDSEAVAEWSAGGPTEVWRIELGDGYAGAAIHKGRVYVLDYDLEKRADVLRCMSLADGKEIWKRSYGVKVRFNHGRSRTIPSVTDEVVVTIGPKCHVSCVDASTGEYRWGIDLVKEYGTTVPDWYAGQCPLIEGDRLILAPAGKDVLLMALELGTGKVLWTVENRHKWEMTHVSVVPMTLLGKKMYVYCGSKGVVAVDEAGGVVWEMHDWRVKMAAVASPVAVGEDLVFFCGGYGAGSMLLRVKKDAEGKFEAEEVYRLGEEEFGSEQQTPIFYGGYLYGVAPMNGGPLACLEVGTGKRVWDSGREKFGIGPYMICGGQVWLVNDKGVLTVAEASTKGYKQLGRWELFEKGHEAWGPMAVAEGRLLVREFRRMVCLDLRAMK